MRRVILILPSLAALAMPHAADAEPMAGPVSATVERVIDGDTFVASANVWPGHSVRVSIRLRGVDAPELRSKCPAERAAAEAARTALEKLIAGAPVEVANIGGGKYYGRVLADVTTASGTGAAEAMLAAGHVRPYAGGRRASSC